MKTKITLIIAIISIIYIVSSCGDDNKIKDELHSHSEYIVLDSIEEKQTMIEVVKFSKRAHENWIQANGLIDVPPQSNISLHIPYGGFVEYTEMLPGSAVRKGQKIVTVTNPDFIDLQTQYLQEKAKEESLLNNWKRQEELSRQEYTSKKLLEQAKSAYDLNQIAIKSIAEKLKFIGFNLSDIEKGSLSSSVNIYSPVDGFIRDIYTNNGKYVNSQDPIMDITHIEDLHVELTIYEKDIPKIQKGQSIRFKLAQDLQNDNSKWREATVFLTGGGVKKDGSFSIHGHLDKNYSDLKPGMYVNAEIKESKDSMWALPKKSLVKFGGKNYIFSVVSKGKFKLHEVKPVDITEDWIYFNAPPEQNTEWVTTGSRVLLAKEKNTEGGHEH